MEFEKINEMYSKNLVPETIRRNLNDWHQLGTKLIESVPIGQIFRVLTLGDGSNSFKIDFKKLELRIASSLGGNHCFPCNVSEDLKKEVDLMSKNSLLKCIYFETNGKYCTFRFEDVYEEQNVHKIFEKVGGRYFLNYQYNKYIGEVSINICIKSKFFKELK